MNGYREQLRDTPLAKADSATSSTFKADDRNISDDLGWIPSYELCHSDSLKEVEAFVAADDGPSYAQFLSRGCGVRIRRRHDAEQGRNVVNRGK